MSMSQDLAHTHHASRAPWREGPVRWLWISSVLAGSLLVMCCVGMADSMPLLLRQYSAEAEVDAKGKAITRPTLSPQQYEALADQLRAQYSLPQDQWPHPQVWGDVSFVELGRVPEPVFPPDNPYSEAKADLGRMLFFDVRLSGSRQMACASCHDPDLAWADGRTVSFGHHRTSLKRNSPSLLNVSHTTPLFWDGRAATLEDQALEVIENPDELNADMDLVVARLQSSEEYVRRFDEVFGQKRITSQMVAQALATYQRTLRSTGRSDFDQFIAGRKDRLSSAAVRGLHLFRTTAGCANCHHGPLMSDNQFHDLGLSYYGRKYQDLGRYEVTKQAADVGKFRTPSLRNVTRTSPYMHLGLFDLPGVLNMYNAGMATLRRKPDQMNDPLFPTKSHMLRPLGLNQQDLSDLTAFLEALEEPRRRVRPPELPDIADDQALGLRPLPAVQSEAVTPAPVVGQ